MFKKHPFAIVTITLLTAFGIFWATLYKLDYAKADTTITYGVTFSKPHAESLKLDWRATLIAALDDLKIRHFRLSAYWNEIEPADDHFNFDALDFQINEITKRGGTIILGVGERLPRWPECHTPDWATKLDVGERHQKILQMLPVVISRYEDNKSIIRWQVENEPLLAFFGRCEPPDEKFLEKEIALVRRMDGTRAVMTTASGEFGDWDTTGRLVDVLGVSLYRTIWKPVIKYIEYPLPAAFYAIRAKETRETVPRIVLSELQTEPWLSGSVLDVPLAEQLSAMNPTAFNKTISYARATGFDEIYLWGVEWWYWLKTTENHPEMWEATRELWK